MPPEHLAGAVAIKSFSAAIPAGEVARDVGAHDRVLGRFDDRRELGARDLEALAFGDIGVDADQSGRLSFATAHHPPDGAEPALAHLRMIDAVFEIEFAAAVEKLPGVARKSLAVFPAHPPQPFVVGDGLLGEQSVQLAERWADGHLAGDQIEVPYA